MCIVFTYHLFCQLIKIQTKIYIKSQSFFSINLNYGKKEAEEQSRKKFIKVRRLYLKLVRTMDTGAPAAAAGNWGER